MQSMEIPRYATSQVKENSETAVDGHWFERFMEISEFSPVEYFSGKQEFREQQKSDFLQEKIRNPELDYPKLKSLKISEKEKKFLDLKRDILQNESNEVIAQAYRWQINAKIAQLRMVECAQTGDDRRFAKYSSFIYGNPEKEIFNYDLEKIKAIIDSKRDSDDVAILLAIRRLEESLAFPSEKTSLENNFSAKSRILEPSASPKKIEFDSERIKEEFEEALEEYRIQGWEIVIDKNKTSITVNQRKKQISIPSDKKLSPSNLKALIAHEIGTHVLRRENGKRSKLALLSYGLDRYSKGEEGVAAYEQQKIVKTEDYAGFDGHLAIGLAMGLDGHKRDFREVFNILRDYYFIKSKERNYQEAWEKAKKDAWNRCVRTFRGTSCNTPGACFTNDIVYREGNIGVWNLIKDNPEEEKRFMIGKYDPTNPRHIWILEQLGISDEDLEMLDKISD